MKAQEVLVRADQNHMATTFEFLISCSPIESHQARRTLGECHQEVSRLELLLSEFLASSPVSKINAAEAFEEIPVSQELIDLLEISKRIWTESQGNFHCLAKSPLPTLTRFALEWTNASPSSSALLWKTEKNAHLSFGAIGKGFALDRVARIIAQNGFENFLLSAGGSSVVLSGFYGPGIPWTWAWSWKKDENGNDLGIRFKHVSGQRIAIGVSGTHEKGKHILNPKTGHPVQGPESALLTRSSAAEADALSTAYFIAPETLPLPSRFPAAWIDSKGVAHWNGAFQKFWGAVSAALLLTFSTAHADETVDLGSLGMESFNPYLFDREKFWLAIPIFVIALILIHLRKTKRMKK